MQQNILQASQRLSKDKLFLENLRNRVREMLQFFQSIKEPFGAKR